MADVTITMNLEVTQDTFIILQFLGLQGCKRELYSWGARLRRRICFFGFSKFQGIPAFVGLWSLSPSSKLVKKYFPISSASYLHLLDTCDYTEPAWITLDT